MHQHKTVAQILLIISILNSVLAAPAVSARETYEIRNAMAARAPAEGAVVVLSKRPYNDGTQSNGPAQNDVVPNPPVQNVEPNLPMQNGVVPNGPVRNGYVSEPDPPGSGSSSGASSGSSSGTNSPPPGPEVHSAPPSPNIHPVPETQPATPTPEGHSGPISPDHYPFPPSEIRPAPQSGEIPPDIQPTNQHADDASSVASSGVGSHEQDVNHPVSPPAAPPKGNRVVKMPKIMTPEKIKVLKYLGAAGLATAYLAAVLPEYVNQHPNNQARKN